MIIVVDTNIVFSALLHSNGSIGSLLFHSKGIFEFYSSAFLRKEIANHWPKLLKVSKLPDEQLSGAYLQILKRMKTIDEALVPESIVAESISLVADIDKDDVDFVALAKHLGGGLWTGDKPLYLGLKAKGFETVYNTSDMLALRMILPA